MRDLPLVAIELMALGILSAAILGLACLIAAWTDE